MRDAAEVIVVAGAHGNLGRLVCQALLERARVQGRNLVVRGLVRRDSSANQPAPTGVGLSEGVDQQLGQHLVLWPVDYQSREQLSRACLGASCVISTLQGLEDVIVDVQSRLLDVAIEQKVRRFIPSDFSGDFTKLPEGSHRNFDLRRRFHALARRLVERSASAIELTSIFQGGFTELLGSGWVLFDYKKRRVNYFGSADSPMEFTTWQNTAEFTAAVALDKQTTPRYLYPAGQRLTPREAQVIAKRVTGADFELKRVMPTGLLRLVIALMKVIKPGKKGDVMPLWVAMQYGYCGALGVMSPAHVDNNRYPDIRWTGVDGVIRQAFLDAGGRV
jgi:NmrA-like family